MNLLARLIGLADRDHWDEIAELRRAWADGTDLDRYRASVLDDLWGDL